MNKKVLLVITDGIGYDEGKEWNAFYKANKPNYDWLFKNVPYSFLSTFGKSIGLPDGQMGNSEVGHMCIGSGRVLYQDLVKISMAIDDGSLSRNNTLLEFISNMDVVHLCGLLSDGGVHSHMDHMIALSKILCSNGKRVYLHIITDGRDVPPFTADKYIKDILKLQHENLSIASISGRFYAMDRDNRWDRIEVAYNAIVRGENKQKSPLEYIKYQYKENISDEFIIPASFNDYEGIKDGEGFIFTNFRSDRAREIVSAIGNKDFDKFNTQKIKPRILTMCEYDSLFTFPILFPKDNVQNTLAEVISDNNLRQAHIAETEKYAHVTFFFNGGREESFIKEDRFLIPSPNVKTYDLLPQMSADKVCDKTIEAMNNNYDFIVVNFANGDMVGHTGNFDAAIKAVEKVDFELGRLIEHAKLTNYSLIITSDHGNCEKMKDENGSILTNHTAGFVWCFVYSKDIVKVSDGALDNVAPSILKLLGLEIPNTMSKALF